jgi:alpha-ketoglutarate-dependent taurine dioxygenase
MTALKTRDLTPGFGAEISGFDPKAPLDDDTRGQLQDLFDKRSLLVFRDIDLTHAEQVAISKVLIRHDKAGSTDETPLEDKFYVSNRKMDSAAPFGRLQFHADTMWSNTPFEVLSLYGVEVEQPTAPTTFVSGVVAWSTLPEDLRARVEGLEVLHTAGAVRRGDLTDVLVSDVANPPSTTTRIGHRHPRTGDTVLYACEQMTKEVVGLPHEESEALLAELFAHLYGQDSFDHEWRERDFVIWDNVAMQHSRKNVAIEGPTRTLRKVASPVPALGFDQRPVFSAPKQ